ncbi:MAG: hypothetical protein AAGC60_12255 [Acidobacteriota bacterium]
MPSSAKSPAVGARARWLLAVVSLAAVALPFVLVRVPPSTDLAQQVAQVRLLGDVLAGGDAAATYRVDWLAPNRLSYALLGASWLAVGPEHAGRVALLVLVLVWVGGLHALAASRGRSAAATTLASVLVFHHALYWGYYGFLLGFPCFALWLHLLTAGSGDEDSAPAGSARLAALAGTSLLLYAAHVLWLGPALVAFGLDAWRRRRALRTVALRVLSLLPIAALVALWYPTLPARFGAATVWGPTPWQRATSPWLVDAAFGGLRGPLEGVFFIVVVSWLVAAFALWALGRRSVTDAAKTVETPAQSVDPMLIAVGALLVAFALVLPARYSLVLHFDSRWMAPGLALLLLAAPPLRPASEPPFGARGSVTALLAVALLGVFVVVTGAGWFVFERAELAGFEDALSALPDEPRLLGLDHQRTSAVVEAAPFYQLFAYGQVLRGGTLNFSFADLATSLVTYREPRMPGYSPATQDLPWRWTPGLEWHPERLRSADLEHFSHVLVHGGEEVQQRFAANPRLEPLSTVGTWHLYAVE